MTLLKERGFTKKQAEGIMEAVQEVTISGVATKEDVQSIKDDMHDLEIGLRADINKVEAKINKVETTLRAEIHGVEAKINKVEANLRDEIQKSANNNLKFQIIQTIAIVSVMVALFQFSS